MLTLGTDVHAGAHLLCFVLAKHGNFRGSALTDCMKHQRGGQKLNFRDRIILFHSHSFERIMTNTFKVLQEKKIQYANPNEKQLCRGCCFGFFFFPSLGSKMAF